MSKVLSPTATEWIVGDEQHNELSMGIIDAFGYKCCKRIIIGNKSFRCAYSFSLCNWSVLESVVIGSNCFECERRMDYHEFSITDCPKLRSIQIGDSSFCRYKNVFLMNLPSLQSIDIGNSCFVRASSLSLLSIGDGWNCIYRASESSERQDWLQRFSLL